MRLEVRLSHRFAGGFVSFLGIATRGEGSAVIRTAFGQETADRINHRLRHLAATRPVEPDNRPSVFEPAECGELCANGDRVQGDHGYSSERMESG